MRKSGSKTKRLKKEKGRLVRKHKYCRRIKSRNSREEESREGKAGEENDKKRKADVIQG